MPNNASWHLITCGPRGAKNWQRNTQPGTDRHCNAVSISTSHPQGGLKGPPIIWRQLRLYVRIHQSYDDSYDYIYNSPPIRGRQFQLFHQPIPSEFLGLPTPGVTTNILVRTELCNRWLPTFQVTCVTRLSTVYKLITSELILISVLEFF